ncbi:glutaredoxin family protein [Paenibacillus sp. LHD-38]|uniref:glutaredoxin family protein n=1 Tax=Paenibacillus sp. LHD-38 TaxID=3072143 RepID=UPI00280ECB2C|nr:glutaredoxin family protein [Paenibacillus sp. LHD-38]MDQ8734852.1 glutaredoxin family protein [Paenibacillus sp. LHD-38]
MNDQLRIYTIPTCSDCTFAKRYFNENNISFSEFNCENNEVYAKEVWELTGKRIVPTIVIKDKVFIGFTENLKEISEVLNIG